MHTWNGICRYSVWEKRDMYITHWFHLLNCILCVLVIHDDTVTMGHRQCIFRIVFIGVECIHCRFAAVLLSDSIYLSIYRSTMQCVMPVRGVVHCFHIFTYLKYYYYITCVFESGVRWILCAADKCNALAYKRIHGHHIWSVCALSIMTTIARICFSLIFSVSHHHAARQQF